MVIGILIALQVNNWNEERKEQDLYQTYLVRLKADFEQLHSMLDWREKKANELVKLTRYQTDFFNGYLNILDTLKLAVSIENSAGMNRYDLYIPTFYELSSTGRLTIIDNDSLKKILNSWQQLRIHRNGEQSEWHSWIEKYRNLTRHILTTEDKMRIDTLWMRPYPDDPMWKDFQLKTKGNKIIKELFEKPELLGLLNDILIFRTITHFSLGREKQLCVETIKLIESELN